MSEPAVTIIERHAGGVVVRVQADSLDEPNMKAVRASVEAAARESPQLPVVIDMAKVQFMVSLSLGELVDLSQQFKGRGQRLVLTNLQPPVRQVIAITRLDKLFEIRDDPSSLLK